MSYIRRVFGQTWRTFFRKLGEDVDLGRYTKQHCIPQGSGGSDSMAPCGCLGSEGLNLQLESQLLRVQSWRDRKYQDLFRQLRQDKRINATNPVSADCVKNGFYHTPDAEIYGGMILDLEPDQIVEVGSGFSTRIARRSIQYGGLRTQLRVIDPQPRADIREDADDITQSRVEDVDSASLRLTDRSILFIDSSHICRMKGDIPFLYCRILPSLPKGAVVHIHDIYIPYEYPNIYGKWLWNEQYTLFCSLAHSSKFEVLLATHLLSRTHTNAMREAISPAVSPETNSHCGCSFWIRAKC